MEHTTCTNHECEASISRTREGDRHDRHRGVVRLPPYPEMDDRRARELSVLRAALADVGGRDGARLGLTLRHVPFTDAEARRRLVDAARESFQRPTPYGMWGWIVDAVPPGKRPEALETLADYGERALVAMAELTDGWLVAVEKDGDVVGGAVMVRRAGFSPSVLVHAAQVAWAATVTQTRWLASWGEVPPALKRVREFGVEHVRRLLASGQLDDHQHEIMRGRGEYIYLLQGGCVPEHQRKGGGTVVLRAITAFADALNRPIYVETDEVHVRDMLRKHGFEVKREYALTTPSSSFAPNFALVREPLASARL